MRRRRSPNRSIRREASERGGQRARKTQLAADRHLKLSGDRNADHDRARQSTDRFRVARVREWQTRCRAPHEARGDGDSRGDDCERATRKQLARSHRSTTTSADRESSNVGAQWRARHDRRRSNL